MSKHTPGPWDYVPGSETKRPVIGRFKDNKRLADVGDHGQTREEREANARLMAASPDLLAVLKSLLDHATIDLGVPEREITVIKARAAIAKAEGEQ